MENSKISEYEERLNKLSKLKELKINPYPNKADITHKVEQILGDFKNLEKNKEKISTAGRLRSIRTHGNLTFASLEDNTGSIQIAISKKDIGADDYKIITKLIDGGDFLEVRGFCFVTHKGENSIMVEKWRLLSKALRPIPSEWYGIKDEDEKFRKRYLDILLNPDTKDMIKKRAKFWQSMRNFLIERGFLEVETPVFENTTGGADAKPFVTHHNALDIDVYLRISMGELWQKRLMVAGLEKTFEIGRQFRNEGMSPEHLQDYTQMEFYWSYANYEDGMKLVEELYKHIVKETFGTLKFKIGKFDVDFGKKWEVYDYCTTIKEYTGIDILDVSIEDIEKKLNELGVKYDKEGFNMNRAIDNLWKYCRKSIGGPGFLINVPVIMEPLAKRIEGNEDFVQRFQVILAGSEMGKGYSELNDPVDQAERFKHQQKLRDEGDDEAQMTDSEFVEALEYGMPPTFGFGISERLFSFLMNKPARECQIFPLMRPRGLNENKADLEENSVE